MKKSKVGKHDVIVLDKKQLMLLIDGVIETIVDVARDMELHEKASKKKLKRAK